MRILGIRYSIQDWDSGMTPLHVLVCTILSPSPTPADAPPPRIRAGGEPHPPRGLRIDPERARRLDSAGETQGMASGDHCPRTHALQGEESTMRGLPGSEGLRLVPTLSTSETTLGSS